MGLLASAETKIGVLVVEDNDDLREMLQTFLEENDMRTWGARDGREALAWLGRPEVLPDLMLLDLMMPGMSGWETIDRLAEQHKGHAIPYVLVTAHRGFLESSRRDRLFAPLVIPKPIDFERLLDTVRNCCAPARAGR